MKIKIVNPNTTWGMTRDIEAAERRYTLSALPRVRRVLRANTTNIWRCRDSFLKF